jgi:hypothetical protein
VRKEISPATAAIVIVAAVLIIAVVGWYMIVRTPPPPPWMPKPGDIPGMPNVAPATPAFPPANKPTK